MINESKQFISMVPFTNEHDEIIIESNNTFRNDEDKTIYTE